MKDVKVAKATAWYLISSFLLKGIGLLTTPIFARILTKEEYGLFNNFSFWLGIVTIVATLSLSASLIRARFDYQDDLFSFISSILLLGSLFTALVGGILWLNITRVTSFFSLEKKYIFILLLYVLTSPAYEMFLAVQRFNYRYKTFVALSVSTTVTSILLSFLFIRLLEDHLLGRVIGAYLPNFLVSCILYWWFLYKGKNVRLSHWSYALPMALPYAFHLLSGSLLSSSDRAMITKICGAESTALYSMAYNIAATVGIVWSSLNNAYSPWLGEMLNKKKYDRIRSCSYGYVGIFTFLVLGVMLAAPEILLFMGGKPYLEAQYAIPPVIAGYFFIFVYSMYVNIEQYEKKTLGMAIATGITAAFNIATNALFIPRFGYIAAAYTTLAGYILLFAVHYFLVRRLGLHYVYPTSFLILIAFLILAVSFGSLILYNHQIYRYCVLLLYFAIVGATLSKKRETIRNYLKKG